MARKIAFLLAIFIACYLSAHFYIRWKNRIQLDTIRTTSLIDCNPNHVRTLKILQREGVAEQMVVLERTDAVEPGLPPAAELAKSRWKESSPVSGEADSAVMNRLASQICELYDPLPQRPEEMIESAVPGRRAQRMEISLVRDATAGAKAEAHEIDFGQVSADRQNVVRYRAAQGERVVKIVPQLLQLSSRAPQDFINRRVLRSAADNIEGAVVSFDGKEKFTVERAGADWRVTFGGKELGVASEEVERYINRLGTLQALEVEPATAKDCTANPRKVGIDITLIGGKKEFVGFDYGSQGKVSACNSERDTKFTIHRDMIKFLDLPRKPAKAKT